MIPVPAKGQKITPWARELTETVNRLAPMGGSNLLVRSGNGGFGFETLPGNPKATPPTPKATDVALFDYERSTETAGGEAATTHKIVNCQFYWRGILQTLTDYTIPAATFADDCSVYLCGVQDAGGDWIWSLGTDEIAAPENGRALNFKLYDFSGGKVACDYRTALLTLQDTGVEALNSLAGKLELLGGPKIRITKDVESGQITIAFDETKEDTDNPSVPTNPCAHPGNPGAEEHSGVAEEFSGIDPTQPTDTPEGGQGVIANGDTHTGDNTCNCD